jgi:hypothetical protein
MTHVIRTFAASWPGILTLTATLGIAGFSTALAAETPAPAAAPVTAIHCGHLIYKIELEL